MSWVPSFLKRKTHKYETQADLDKLTADEIIHLDPKEVGFYVEKNEGGVKLTGPKRTSMLRLLSIKRDEKNNPSLIRLRASVVDKLTNQDKEVEKLMRDTQAEIDSGNTMRNRLTLLDMPQVPTTRPTISRKGGRKSINTIKRRATRAKRAIRRSSKMSYKRMQRTRRR
jgi:hypothetical protein